MKQITTTVEQFLSAIVGVGLICFFSFILLLASAKLNDSLLGDLLASLAGETARTARTESFAYWGKFGQEVADGLGVFQGGGVAVQPTPTAVTVVATLPPNPNPQPTATPSGQPATPPPVAYIRESQLSKAGVYLWQGLDPTSFQPQPYGVNLEAVKSQTDNALKQHSGDLTAIWLQKQLDRCYPVYQRMLQGIAARNRTQTYAEADSLLACNPRAVIGHVAKRWADIWALPTSQAIDSADPIIWPSNETEAMALLSGLNVAFIQKLGDPGRGFEPTDNIGVAIVPPQDFASLGQIRIVFTVAALDAKFGRDNWNLTDKNTATVPGPAAFPDPSTQAAPNPAAPSEADLVPPTTPTNPNTPSGAAGGAESTTYTVQAGDTAMSIARQFNLTLEALIAANPDTLGANASLIYPGQVLNIPAP